MTEALDRRALDATERAFWGDLWAATPPDVAAAHGVELRTFGPVQVTTIRELPDAAWMNLVLGATEPSAAADLIAALDWAESLGIAFYVPVTPGLATSQEVERLLTARGYEQGYAWMKFVRDGAPPERPDPPGVEIVKLAAGDGERLGEIVAAGFGLPPWTGTMFGALPGRLGWHCYLALVDGEPAGAATLRVHGDVAELGAAATLESARGRGCQTALLHRRIRDGAAAGARVLLVETGERTEDRPSASYRNILRAGFREAYLRPNWRLPAAATT